MKSEGQGGLVAKWVVGFVFLFATVSAFVFLFATVSVFVLLFSTVSVFVFATVSVFVFLLLFVFATVFCLCKCAKVPGWLGGQVGGWAAPSWCQL